MELIRVLLEGSLVRFTMLLERILANPYLCTQQLDPMNNPRLRVYSLNEKASSVYVDLQRALLPSEQHISDEFDPRQIRCPSKPITPWMAYFIMLRTVFGAGALALPLVVSKVGYLVGVLMMVLTGIVLIHMHQCLLWCLNECSRKLRVPYVNYRLGFRLTLLHGPDCLAKWGEMGPHIVGVVMVINQLCLCTVIVIFTASSLKDIADFKETKTALQCLFVPYLCMAIAMKNLKIISYISMLGSILNLIGMVLVLIEIFEQPLRQAERIVIEPLPLLFCFGTILFNQSTVAVILVLDRSLKNPYLLLGKTGMISVATGVSTFVGCVFGVLGYWSFGPMDDNVIRSLPVDDQMCLAAIGIYSISITFTYPIQCYPGLYILGQMISGSGDPRHTQHFQFVIEVVARVCFVTVTFFISYVSPFQSAFVAFAGNLCTILLAIIFPAVMEMCLRYPNEYGPYKIHLLKVLLIIILGSVTWAFGVVLCGNFIYIRILSMASPNAVN